MSNKKPVSSLGVSQQRENVLFKWANEDGAHEHLAQQHLTSPQVQSEALPFTNLELEQLRLRVIAMENLVIALLAEGSYRQRELGREMAAYISPRPGFTNHHTTLGAASQMIHIIERADYFNALNDENVS